MPRAVSAAASFGAKPVFPFPWSSVRAIEAPAARRTVPAPEFRLEEESVSGGKTRFRGLIVSPRGATFARIAFPPETRVDWLRIAGIETPPLSGRALSRGRDWKSYACVTLPAAGIQVEGEISGAPAEFVLMDRSPGIPEAGAPILRARPASAVPSQTGDVSIVTRRIRLSAP